MASFTPDLMATIAQDDCPTETRGGIRRTSHLFHWSGSTADALESARIMQADKSPAGRRYAEFSRQEHRQKWSGLGAQTADNVIETGLVDAAVETFKTAKASFQPPLIRGGFVQAVQGPAFNIGRIIEGHPLCALNRPRAKLPPLNLNIVLSISWRIAAEEVAASLVQIIRAAWQYKLAGGIVSLTLHYCSGFSAPHLGCSGLLMSIRVPLANQGQLASVCSIQFFRAFYLPFAKALSGKHDDSLPLVQYCPANSYQLTGKRADDALILAALRIPGQ